MDFTDNSVFLQCYHLFSITGQFGTKVNQHTTFEIVSIGASIYRVKGNIAYLQVSHYIILLDIM